MPFERFFRIRFGWTWGVVTVGMVLTAFACVVAREEVERGAKTGFESQTSRLFELFEHEMQERLAVFFNLRSLVETMPGLSAEQFSGFLAGQHGGEFLAGVNWTALVRHVPGAGAGRPAYYVSYFPADVPEVDLRGMDLGGDADNRRVFEQAGATGVVHLTRLAGVPAREPSCRVAVIPVFRPPAEGNPEEDRAKRLTGFVLVQFDFSRFGWAVFGEELPGGFRVLIEDRGQDLAGKENRTLFDSGYWGRAGEPSGRVLTEGKILAFGQGALGVEIFADARVLGAERLLPLWAALLGSAITLLVAVGVYRLQRAGERAAEMARSMAEKFHRSEERFRKLVETGNDWIWETDARGVYTYVSPNTERVLGYGPQEILGTDGAHLWVSSDPVRAALAGRSAAGGPPLVVERTALHKSGRRIELESSVVSVFGARGERLGIRGFDRDVTERKRMSADLAALEQRISALARVETVSQAMAGMAHELNQPLAAIAAYNQACLRMLDAAPLPKSSIAEAMLATATHAQAAAGIVRRFREFFAERRLEIGPVRIEALVKDALSLVRHRLESEKIRVKVNVAEGLPELRGDRVFLTQALVNLLVNAIEAMQAVPERELSIAASLQAGKWMEVAVSDKGKGIEGEASGKLFEPYYTTKEEGIGLGLAISRSIVEAHEGEIGFGANPQGGCTFWIRLPLRLQRHDTTEEMLG